jgi:hypothetical protein
MVASLLVGCAEEPVAPVKDAPPPEGPSLVVGDSDTGCTPEMIICDSEPGGYRWYDDGFEEVFY